MTSVFETGRADPHTPVALTPLAAADGIPDDDGGEGGGVDLSFFLSLGAQLGSVADSLQADQRRRESMVPPGNEQLFKSGVAPGSGVLTLDLGSVPQGRVWQIRRIIVGAAKVTTAVDGEAYAFAQGAPPADLALTDCVDIFDTLPQGNTYGSHQLYLQASEHLFIVFIGATEGTQYGASARVEDWNDDTFRSTFSE
jgi:hypothetical protein